jgi:hypothetical protein
VAVWSKVPAFVQQTVSPALMVTELGVNEKSAIVTIVSLELQAPRGRAGEARAEAVRTASSPSSASEIPLPIPMPTLRFTPEAGFLGHEESRLSCRP